jgi:hypothetical protein
VFVCMCACVYSCMCVSISYTISRYHTPLLKESAIGILMEEEQHVRPGLHWLFLFGDAGNQVGERVHKTGRQGEMYKGTRFCNGDRALVDKKLKWQPSVRRFVRDS